MVGQARHRVDVAVAHGGSLERDDAAALQDPVEDGFGEVGIVQDAALSLK